MSEAAFGLSSRWDSPKDFDGFFFGQFGRMWDSVAGYLNYEASNIHDLIMRTGCSKWVKISALLLLDTAVALVVPFVAVTEAVLRLALAILTLPLCCSEKRLVPVVLMGTAIYSLAEMVNVLFTIYKTMVARKMFDPSNTGSQIGTALSCGLYDYTRLNRPLMEYLL